MNDTRPTNIRFLIVALATLMSFVLYLDRFCVSFAVDYIRQDLSLTHGDMKWFLSAFFFSYALAQVPSGWLSDRYGARIMLVIYILTWSLFTGLIGASYTFFMLISTRLMCGLCQAGAYPTAASVVKRWVPITARGTASSFVANGGRIGGAMAPVMTAYLIVMFVPFGTPVDFKESDVLQREALVEALHSQTMGDIETAPARHVRSVLTPEERDRIDSLVGTSGASARVENTDLAPILNGLLRNPELYSANAMPTIKLPREGLDVLKRLDAGDAVADEERRRFNRFVLEAVFNRELKKFYGQGWRPILWIYGGAGIFVAAIFWFLFRERPETHSWCNEAEHALVLQGREETAGQAGERVGPAPMKAIISSGNLWLNCIGQWGTNVGWLFVFTWLPRYLMEMHQVPIIQRGYMMMTPALIGMVGMFCGGRLSDVIARRVGIKWGRRIPVVSSRLLAILAYVGAIGLSTLPTGHPLNGPWVYTALFSIVAFSTDFGSAPNWAFMQDVGGRHVGSVLGWGNMWGNLGAFFAPLIYDYFLGENPGLREWNMMFGVCALSFAVSGLCWLKIDATKPVVPDEH